MPEALQCSRGNCLSYWLFLQGTWVIQRPGISKGKGKKSKIENHCEISRTTDALSINLPWPFCLCSWKSNSQARANVMSQNALWCTVGVVMGGERLGQKAGSPMPCLFPEEAVSRSGAREVTGLDWHTQSPRARLPQSCSRGPGQSKVPFVSPFNGC